MFLIIRRKKEQQIQPEMHGICDRSFREFWSHGYGMLEDRHPQSRRMGWSDIIPFVLFFLHENLCVIEWADRCLQDLVLRVGVFMKKRGREIENEKNSRDLAERQLCMNYPCARSKVAQSANPDIQDVKLFNNHERIPWKASCITTWKPACAYLPGSVPWLPSGPEAQSPMHH